MGDHPNYFQETKKYYFYRRVMNVRFMQHYKFYRKEFR
nr:MAG TPA: hypothetical protein [Caudoviricetes sp.]